MPVDPDLGGAAGKTTDAVEAVVRAARGWRSGQLGANRGLKKAAGRLWLYRSDAGSFDKSNLSVSECELRLRNGDSH